MRKTIRSSYVLTGVLAIVLGATWFVADRASGQRLPFAATTAPPGSSVGAADNTTPLVTCQTVNTWPAKPEKDVLYLGIPPGESKPSMIMLLCPCGCGDSLTANLRPERDPHWRLEIDPQGRPTLQPSYWRNGHCESHFMLLAGRIYMIPKQPPIPR